MTTETNETLTQGSAAAPAPTPAPLPATQPGVGPIPDKAAVPVDDQPIIEEDAAVNQPAAKPQETATKIDDVAEVEIDNIVSDLAQDTKPSSAVLLEGDPLEVLSNLLTATYNVLGEVAFARDATTPDTRTNILARAFNEASDEGSRVLESLSKIADLSNLVTKHQSEHGVVGLRIPVTNQPAPGPVSGNEGLIEFSRRRGSNAIRRIPLLNSGFYIDLEASPNSQLHKFFTAVVQDVNTYGKEFGANFYLYSDLLTKQAFVDLFMYSIVGSNLHSWNKTGALEENISLNDFKVIVLMLAYLMYPEGYDDFTHVCTNPAVKENGLPVCTHVDKAKIDIQKLFRFDKTKLNDAAVKHMCRKGGSFVTQEEIEAYHKELNFSKTLTFKSWRLQMSVPSLRRYLDYGNLFNGELVNDVQADNNNGMYQALGFRYYRTFTPWITEIALVDENGTVQVPTNDQQIIPALLDKIQSEDTEQELLKKFHDYVASTEISHICYPVFECPACHHVPETKTGYFTVDPAHTFFTLLLRKFRES